MCWSASVLSQAASTKGDEGTRTYCCSMVSSLHNSWLFLQLFNSFMREEFKLAMKVHDHECGHECPTCPTCPGPVRSLGLFYRAQSDQASQTSFGSHHASNVSAFCLSAPTTLSKIATSFSQESSVHRSRARAKSLTWLSLI